MGDPRPASASAGRPGAAPAGDARLADPARGGVVVVGGGITGLAAAYELTRAGVPVVLVEASGRLGGKVLTKRIEGFLVEAGPDSFISYRPAATELALELGLGAAIIGTNEPRKVFIRSRGAMVPMPDGMGLVLPTRMAPFVTTPLFTWPEKLRAGLDVLLPRSLNGADASIGAFLRHRLGGAMVERLAEPLLGGIYGAPVDELSLLAVAPQLRDYERDHRSLLLASLAQGRATRARSQARAGWRGAAPAGGPARARRAPDGVDPAVRGGPAAGGPRMSGSATGSLFLTLAGGLGSLVDALVESIRSAPGAQIRLGTGVAALERDGARTAVRLADGTRLLPDAVVLAAPAPVSAALLAAEAPTAAEAISRIPHGTTGVVTMAYAADAFDKPPAGHGVLVAADEQLAVGACTITSSKWAARAPDGTVLIRAFVPERSADLLLGPDDAVVAVIHADLGRLFGVRDAPLLRDVARWTGAMPRYTVGHLERVAAAERALEARPEIALCGGAFHGVGVPECVARGRDAARRVIGLVGAEITESHAAVPA